MVAISGISVLTNIISNIIYDIGKSSFMHITNQLNKNDIYGIVKSKISEQYIEISESGIVKEFLNTPQVYDVLYQLTCLRVLKSLDRKENYVEYLLGDDVQKEDSFSEEKLYLYLSQNLIQKFRKETVIEGINQKVINDYFENIISLSVECVLNEMEEEKILVGALTKNINLWGRVLYSNINNILTILRNADKFKIVDTIEQFEATNKEYMECLRMNNSKAHIYLLDTFEFSQFYVPPILAAAFKKEPLRRNSMIGWENIFERKNIIYITGGAGYGKSLFLKNIINNTSKMCIPCIEEYIVIYGELKAFYNNVSDSPISVVKFLQSSIIKETLLDENKITKNFVEYYLKRGRCIVLLDALDEVEQAKRKELHRKVVNFFKGQNPNNKICITSRNRGFIPQSNILCYTIMPLSEREINQYVDKIISLGKFDAKDKESFIKQTKQLIQNHFLNSFLVLSLLINIYKAERELPENKLELYQKCFDFIANRREKEKSGFSIKWSNIGPLMKDSTFIELAELCFPNNIEVSKKDIKSKLIPIYTPKFGNEINAENAIDEFLDFCSDRTELFVPATGEEMFRFFHRSFFEYFYSQYIFTKCDNEHEIYAKLITFDVDSEVFELTIAMLKQKSEYKYQKLIELIFSQIEQEFGKKKSSYLPFNILTLGMQVIDDKLYKDRFISLFEQYKEKFVVCGYENEEIIISVIKQNEDYVELLNNVNYSSVALSILISLKEILNILKKNDYKENVHDIYYEMGRKGRSTSTNFFIKLFIATVDLEQWIDSLNNVELRRIKEKAQPTNKKWYGIQSSVKNYRNMDKQMKNFVVRAIITYFKSVLEYVIEY